MRVLRIYHSGVVTAWRRRDRELRALGADVRMVSSRRWNEGGADVVFESDGDDFATTARTFGRHPYRFVYDPRPIWRALSEHRPEVIDCHEEPASLAAFETLVLRAVARSHAPILFYGAQNIEKRYPPPFRWIERWALRTAAGVHVCNAEAADIFRRKGFTGTSKVLGLGVDRAVYAAGPPREPGTTFRVGYVGRLEQRKGIHVVIDALAGTQSDIELHVYGSGPDEQWLRQRAAERNLADRVHFHGFTPQADLPETYRRLDVVVVPSQTTPAWVEQFGRVVVEAMACGTPVIGSDSGSVPEVTGDAGIVVGEADVEAWRAAIVELAHSAERRRSLREAGLRHVEQYEWSAIAAGHLELYRSIA